MQSRPKRTNQGRTIMNTIIININRPIMMKGEGSLLVCHNRSGKDQNEGITGRWGSCDD